MQLSSCTVQLKLISFDLDVLFLWTFSLTLCSYFASSFSSLAPQFVPSNVRTETLSAKSIRVQWMQTTRTGTSSGSSTSSGSYSTGLVEIKSNFDGFYIGFREIEELASSRNSLPALSRQTNTYTFKTIEVNGKGQSALVSPTNGRSDFQATLTELKRNTRYGIIVQAFNKKGPGPSSDEIVAQTLEFGKNELTKLNPNFDCLALHSILSIQLPLTRSWFNDREGRTDKVATANSTSNRRCSAVVGVMTV